MPPQMKRFFCHLPRSGHRPHFTKLSGANRCFSPEHIKNTQRVERIYLLHLIIHSLEPKRRISKQWKGISFWTISLRSLSDRLSPFRLLGSAPNPRKILTDVFDCRPKSDKPCANRRKRNAAGSIAMIPPAFFFPAGDRSLYILRNTKNQRRLFCTIFRRFAWLKTIQIDNFIVI